MVELELVAQKHADWPKPFETLFVTENKISCVLAVLDNEIHKIKRVLATERAFERLESDGKLGILVSYSDMVQSLGKSCKCKKSYKEMIVSSI